jgi:hypothetical protein
MGISGEPQMIWKYNAIYHLLSEHPFNGIFDPDSTVSPKLPRVMAVNMFISQKEESLLKVAGAATLKKQETYQLSGSNNVEEIKEELE